MTEYFYFYFNWRRAVLNMTIEENNSFFVDTKIQAVNLINKVLISWPEGNPVYFRSLKLKFFELTFNIHI